MLTGFVHEANIQDRDGTPGAISLTCASVACLVHVFADGGYAGEKLEDTLAKDSDPAIEIVKRTDNAQGFVPVARRRIVERTLIIQRITLPPMDADHIKMRILSIKPGILYECSELYYTKIERSQRLQAVSSRNLQGVNHIVYQ
jgi:hypothetical protein